jgi:GTPase SAR1 family protein
MNVKGLLVSFLIIIYVVTIIGVVWWIAMSGDASIKSAEALMAGALFILGPMGILLFEPVRVNINSWLSNSFVNPSIYRILIFGHAGSGKTTFIETAFTFGNDTNTESTKEFKYYKFKIVLGLQEEEKNVAIADYRGQKLSQIILDGDKNFFGTKNNRLINAIIFIVDLVPRQTDNNGIILDNDQLIKWLSDGNGINEIESRLRDNYMYINRNILQVLFELLLSRNLQKVVFLINKIDIMETLIDNGHISLTNYSNARQYALHKYEDTILEIDKFCSANNIDFSQDKSVFCIEGTNPHDVKPVILHLLKSRQ